MVSLKKSLVFGCAVLLTALVFITGCSNPSSSDIFVPVTDITGVPATGAAGTEVDLSGARVAPTDADYQTIAWSVKDAGTTGLSSAGIANARFTPAQPGTLVLTATIPNGTDRGTDYTQDFTLTIDAVAVPGIPNALSLVAGDSMLGVTWEAVAGATSYDVYYSDSATPPPSPVKTVTGTAFANITDLTNGILYYVWVKAKNNLGVSDFSTVASGSPAAVVIPTGLNRYFQSLPYSAAYAYYDDGFAVDTTAKIFYQYGDSTFDTKWSGTIVKIVPDGETYIMIVRVTEVTGTWSTPPEIGKYFAAAYQNLTSFAVKESAAFLYGGEKNTGVATIAEAVSEYTAANGYFYLDPLYYPHTTSAVTLASLQGDWEMDGMSDYFIQIRGTKLTEWYDDGDGVYDSTDDSGMLGELGDIVDSTDSSQASGVLYVKVIASDLLAAEKFIAIAWKNKTASSISFMTDTTAYDTLQAVKAARNDPANSSQFNPSGFYDYTK
jgi:hypothetical protein